MLILLFLLLQASGQPQAVEPSPDVIVRGQHLSKLRLDISIDGDFLMDCHVAVSSGDTFIDSQACRAADVCVSRGMRTSSRLLACIDHRIALAVSRHDATKSEN
jgi:hypothetical protein